MDVIIDRYRQNKMLVCDYKFEEKWLILTYFKLLFYINNENFTNAFVKCTNNIHDENGVLG